MSPSVLTWGKKHFSSTTGGFSDTERSKMAVILISDDPDRKWSKKVVTHFSPNSRLFKVVDHENNIYFGVRPSDRKWSRFRVRISVSSNLGLFIQFSLKKYGFLAYQQLCLVVVAPAACLNCFSFVMIYSPTVS